MKPIDSHNPFTFVLKKKYTQKENIDMKIKSFIRDLHAVTQAKIAEDATLLKTPSGKIKQDTFFERAIGFGKKIIAKIQGKSYELKRISYEEGKKEIENRLTAQYLFFSESKEINSNTKIELESLAETFINSMSAFDEFSKNPEEIFLEKVNQNGAYRNFPGTSPKKNAFSNIKNVYQEIKQPKQFKVKARLFEEKYKKPLAKNESYTVINTDEIKTINELCRLANYAMDSHNEPINDAITLAKIMHRDELKDTTDLLTKYEISKIFADRYLRRKGSAEIVIRSSDALDNIKNLVAQKKFPSNT